MVGSEKRNGNAQQPNSTNGRQVQCPLGRRKAKYQMKRVREEKMRVKLAEEAVQAQKDLLEELRRHNEILLFTKKPSRI